MDLEQPPSEVRSPVPADTSAKIVAPPLHSTDLPQVTAKAFATTAQPIARFESQKGCVTDVAELPVAELSDWRRRFDEVYSRLEASLTQAAATTHAQDEDVAQYKVATQGRIDQLTLLCEQLQADVARLTGSERALQQLVQQRDERIRDLEQENYALRTKCAQAVADTKQALSRAEVAELARRVSEVRQQELQVSSQYAMNEATKLRGRLLTADEAARDSLLAQLSTFETLRQNIIDSFSERERALVSQMNATVASVHGGLQRELHAYCETLENKHSAMVDLLRGQFEAFCTQRDRQYGDQVAHLQQRCGELEHERQQVKKQCDEDMRTHTDQCKRREDQLLLVIAEREQALLQREAKLRREQASAEQAMEAKWAAKERELTTRHEAALEATRDDTRRELSRIQTSFMEHLQKLSDAHLAAEQESQERQRERERHLAAASVRQTTSLPSGVGAGDTSELLKRATESNFLSKFDAIEARQRERAEQVRSTLRFRSTDADQHALNSVVHQSASSTPP